MEAVSTDYFDYQRLLKLLGWATFHHTKFFRMHNANSKLRPGLAVAPQFLYQDMNLTEDKRRHQDYCCRNPGTEHRGNDLNYDG